MKRYLLALAISVSGSVAGAQPYILTHEHCDIRVRYDPDATNQLEFVIRDSDRGIVYKPAEVILTATEASRLTLPGDIPPLGTADAPIWVLPATQNPQVLYLGFSGDGIPQNVFDGPVEIQLLSTSGPGDFFVWQAGGTGALEFQMDTTDGVNQEDVVLLFPGGHSHHNWGFSSNGIVTITLQATARRVGALTKETSIETAFTFHVLPIPASPETPFALWQKTHWPSLTDLALIGPDADPDADGLPNLLEYAFGLDPMVRSLDGIPQLSIREIAGETFAVLTYRQAKVATDLHFEPVAANNLLSPHWQLLTDQLEVTNHESHQLITVRDPVQLADSADRFFQLRVSLKTAP